jgi:hypothetical protein
MFTDAYRILYTLVSPGSMLMVTGEDHRLTGGIGIFIRESTKWLKGRDYTLESKPALHASAGSMQLASTDAMRECFCNQ